MFEISEHGGSCCGASHIENFPFVGTKEEGDVYEDLLTRNIELSLDQLTDNWVEGHMEYDGDTDEDIEPERPDVFHHLFEVILTRHQRQSWHDRLIKRGFVEGVSWVNSNTDNTLTMYTYAS